MKSKDFMGTPFYWRSSAGKAALRELGCAEIHGGLPPKIGKCRQMLADFYLFTLHQSSRINFVVAWEGRIGYNPLKDTDN